MRLTKGFGSIMVIFVVMVILLALGGLVFFSMEGKLPGRTAEKQAQMLETEPKLEPDVSDSSEVDDLKAEFEATQVGEIETEFKEMKTSASSL